MNVLHYFLGSPVFAEPPMIVHLGVDDALNPDELAALMAEWQNPTYPEDSYWTDDQFNAAARLGSLQRAQSPGVLLCLLETVDSVTHPEHIHTFSECMDYRAHQVIAPSDPWIYWSLYDEYPFGLPGVIQPPNPPHGWTPIARVNPRGISEMNGWSGGWQGYTIATQIGASQFLTGWGPGFQIRIIVAAGCIFGSLYIGPATQKPFVASNLYRLTFGGQNTNIMVDATFSDGGVGMTYTRMSDPLVQDIDTSNGLIICGYISGILPGWPAAYIQTRGSEQDWSCRYAGGDHAADLDKSKLASGKSGGWLPGGVSDYAVLMVEALY